MGRRLVTFVAVLLTYVLALYSCRNYPTMISASPVIREFLPSQTRIESRVGDTLFFSVHAVDPNERPLSFEFKLGDSTVAFLASWAYTVDDTGDVDVACYVSNGTRGERLLWQLQRLPAVNLPPVITYFEPEDASPSIIIGDSIDFTIMAEDPEGKAVRYSYSVNDTPVSEERQYRYHSKFVGPVEIRAVASDGQRGSAKIWNLLVTHLPDSILPAPVRITSLKTGSEAGEVDVAWIAVGDDSMEGMPSQYQIRTSSFPIVSEFEWDRASDRPGEPSPLPPGDTMRTVISGLVPANDVYASIRALDEFGNISPLGNSIGTKVKGLEINGVVRDAVSTQPVANVEIQLSVCRDTTELDGSFGFLQLPQLSTSMILSDESDISAFGNYFDVNKFYKVRNKDFLVLWMLPNANLKTTNYASFLSFFKIMTDTQENPFGNDLRRWRFPLKIFVPQKQHLGIDYRQEVISGIATWESLSGFDLFEVVVSEPDTGVAVAYEDSTYAREKFSITQRTDDMYPVKGVIHLKVVYDSSSVSALRVIVRHELGHALGLKHSSDANHLMVGGRYPAVSEPSQDELMVLHALFHLPRGESMDDHLSN